MATFGIGIKEYKNLKRIGNPKKNLRDHMSDWELILSTIGEKATTDITKSNDSKGFNECSESAKLGGGIAKNTRLELEEKIGKKIISDKNFLNLGDKID